YDLITDVIPCEDAYTQERALLDQALALMVGNDCVIADRNFCTTKFLFGIAERLGYFIIRQHGANLVWQPIGKVRKAGKDGSGRQLQEQRILQTDPATGKTKVVRRIIVPLRKANDKGEKSLYVLTNVSRKQATALMVADWYAQRWTIEKAFQQLTD